MAPDHSTLRDRMIAVNLAIGALESIERDDDAAGIALVVLQGFRAYTQLLELRNTSQLTPADAELAQTALDALRAKLRYFGCTA